MPSDEWGLTNPFLLPMEVLIIRPQVIWPFRIEPGWEWDFFTSGWSFHSPSELGEEFVWPFICPKRALWGYVYFKRISQGRCSKIHNLGVLLLWYKPLYMQRMPVTPNYWLSRPCKVHMGRGFQHCHTWPLSSSPSILIVIVERNWIRPVPISYLERCPHSIKLFFKKMQFSRTRSATRAIGTISRRAQRTCLLKTRMGFLLSNSGLYQECFTDKNFFFFSFGQWEKYNQDNEKNTTKKIKMKNSRVWVLAAEVLCKMLLTRWPGMPEAPG